MPAFLHRSSKRKRPFILLILFLQRSGPPPPPHTHTLLIAQSHIPAGPDDISKVAGIKLICVNITHLEADRMTGHLAGWSRAGCKGNEPSYLPVLTRSGGCNGTGRLLHHVLSAPHIPSFCLSSLHCKEQTQEGRNEAAKNCHGLFRQQMLSCCIG